VALFLALAAAFRWIALGSMVASACLPVFAYWLGEADPGSGMVHGGAMDRVHPVVSVVAGAGLILVKHQANLRRMLAGTEPRFRIAKK